jgi:hypothetical protein
MLVGCISAARTAVSLKAIVITDLEKGYGSAGSNFLAEGSFFAS